MFIDPIDSYDHRLVYHKHDVGYYHMELPTPFADYRKRFAVESMREHWRQQNLLGKFKMVLWVTRFTFLPEIIF